MSTPEGKVKAKVKALLDKLAPVYRFMPVQNGFGTPSLDFLICFRGMFIAIETKVPGKDLTPRQRLTKAEIEEAGGKVFMVDGEETLAVLAAHLRLIEAACRPNTHPK